MITGRITYGIGQVDPSTPVAPAFVGMPIGQMVAQSSVAQTAPVEWGLGEWAVVIGLGLVAFSVFSTAKRGAGHVGGWYGRRKRRLAEYHSREAEHYKS